MTPDPTVLRAGRDRGALSSRSVAEPAEQHGLPLDAAEMEGGDSTTPVRPATAADRAASRAADIAFGGQGSDHGEEHPADNGSLLLLAGFVGAILAIGFLRSWWFPGILGGLLFMLFMHELGHYVTARASGMKVTEFFLGFGPKIWSFNRGETEYGVKAIPAGAYVRIMGMTNLDDIDPAEEHRTYRAQPYWQRMMTICAGSAMHFLMATVALVVLFASYGYPGFNGPPWSVSTVVEGSTAANLGVETGDRIESINGRGFANWDEFGDVVGELEEGPVSIVIERDGRELQLDGELGVRPEDILLDGFGLNLQREVPGVGLLASFVWPQDPADEFGIEQGDVIARIDDIQDPTLIEMAQLLRARVGDEVTVEVLRGGEIVSLVGVAQTVADDGEADALLELFGLESGDIVLSIGDIGSPSAEELRTALAEADGENVRVQVFRGGETVALQNEVELRTDTRFRGFFGVGRSFDDPPQRNALESVGPAVQDFGTIAKVNLLGIADLVNPANWGGGDTQSFDNRAAEIREDELARQQAVEAAAGSECGGPDTNRPLSVVGIGRLISCSESADQVLFLFAVVNIFIGIFNLVPLLPLDGGHALIATYERGRELVTGKRHRVDAAKLVPITWVVILLLVGVGVWTVTLDIFSW